MSKIYFQTVEVFKNSRSGFDHDRNKFKHIIMADTEVGLKTKLQEYVDKNTYSHVGDFGIVLQESRCEVHSVIRATLDSSQT